VHLLKILIGARQPQKSISLRALKLNAAHDICR
jgi:hypothetical protein